MHARIYSLLGTLRLDRQGWWHFPWSVVAAIALGLALVVPPHLVQAKMFQCGAGDVACLITAIKAANAHGQTNTIRLAAGTYPLTAVDNDTDGANGLPVITSTLTITGAGATTTSIRRDARAPAFRLLRVAAPGVVTLQGLTLSGGAPLFVDGGGIFNSGTLTLTQSTITDNRANNRFGGGIFNSGTLTLTQSTITDNGAAAGGGMATAGGKVTITNSMIADNGAGFFGGGLSNGAGRVTITTTTFAGNFADGGAAISNGDAPGESTLIVMNAAFIDNIAGHGPGTIVNGSILHVTNTTVAHNTVVAAPGPHAGAGIYNGGTLILTNSTLADNQTQCFHLFCSVISGGLVSTPGATTTLQNTLLAHTVEGLEREPECFGPVTSLGNNLIGDPTGCTITLQGTDLTGDPGLDTFTDNGTPGNGHFPLLPTSRAIDAGNENACPRTDQMGQRRVGPCDIGAIRSLDQDDHPAEDDTAEESD